MDEVAWDSDLVTYVRTYFTLDPVRWFAMASPHMDPVVPAASTISSKRSNTPYKNNGAYFN